MNTRAHAFRHRPAVFEDRPIDRSVIIGAAICFALIAVGIASGGTGFAALDPLSIFIVFGGTFGATLINYSWHDIAFAWSSFKASLFVSDTNCRERIEYLVRLAQSVRTNGLLVLEREATSSQDEFLRMALELTVDGQQADDIKRILETEMRSAQEKSSRGSLVFQTMGTYSPALGLIGTIIGMMRMLAHLSDPATVGPAMGTALITTLYGAVLANLVFLPIAGKLRNMSDEQILVKAITIEGILAVGRQENPAIVEQRLQGFLPLIPKV